MRILSRLVPVHARPYYLRNAGASWSATDKERLRALADGNTPTRVIAFKLGRTVSAVKHMASELGVSLKPVNQSPYGHSA